MSKLTKFILMLILFTTTFFIVSATEYVTFALVTAPGGDIVEVDRIHLFTDPENPDQISYIDSFHFWSDSFREGIEQDEYRVRSWFKWQWWQNGTGFIDKGLTFVIEGFDTYIIPISQVKEMYLYYGYNDILDWAQAYYEVPTITSNTIGDPNYIGNYPEYIRILSAITDRDNGYTSGSTGSKEAWLKAYNDVYNTEQAIQKYNAVDSEGNLVFEQYMIKFFNSEEIGGEVVYTSIKTSGAFLFYQITLAIFLSLYFVYQSPLKIRPNEFGENEVQGNFLPRLPKIHRRKRQREKK